MVKVAKVSEAVLEVLPGGRKAILGGDMEERRRARSLLDLLPKVGPFGDIPTIPAELEAQYRGSWHAAKLIARLQETAQITWDYNGSQDEVSLEQVRLRTVGPRAQHLRTARVLVLVGPERCRVRAVLAAMAATEDAPKEDANVEICDGWPQVKVRRGRTCSQFLDPGVDSIHLYEIVLKGLSEKEQHPGVLDLIEKLRSWRSQNAKAVNAVQRQCALSEATKCPETLAPEEMVQLLMVAPEQWRLSGYWALGLIERPRPVPFSVFGEVPAAAREYLTWAQKSRQSADKRPHGGALSVMDADMRDDVLIVLLPEQALRLSPERLAGIERETGTLLVFDRGGGSALPQGIRRLLVCGSSDLRRANAASQEPQQQEQEREQWRQTRSNPWDVLATIPWPQSINEWGRLKSGYVREWPSELPAFRAPGCMSKTHRYYVRLSDSVPTFDESQALA
ncbi:hypothetical protein AK812_SmicGene6180 [Symbiodinium microadriaticum]|uniref:Uncharacterized protein n=1 Tax=Symbiodinium microadriaticum TaxID=2951 RepID=A0A1Q9ERW7_SYMMI|nr:hypothetical protein AK812_SmicGene6180 [Symbiodinium microadriaticum]